MYIVSACLAGFNTRYDGANSMDERVKRLVAEGRAIPVCPEQLAGLPTPRTPVEFDGGEGSQTPSLEALAALDGRARAVGKDGRDYTEALVKGAEETLGIAELYGIKEAVLKDGSPSCGVTYVYSRGQRTPGRGVAAEALLRKNIKVITVDSL